MILLRSLAFNLAFYLVTALLLIVTLPFFFFLSQRAAMSVVRFWANACIFLLALICGTKFEVRGRENAPAGPLLVASKHQSAFETFALIPLFDNPTFAMKESIRYLPIFGWYTIKAGMIHIDRAAGASALRTLAVRAREEVGKGRQLLIFPEGTRRPPGAPSDYQGGVAFLYRSLNVPVLPVGLNSGVFWPRRSFRRYPGTIVMELLPPIAPGLDSRSFLAKLQERIEPASDRLLVEAAASRPPPPLGADAEARLAALRAASV